jgi:hypothetical protein
LAVFSAIATSRTNHLLAHHIALPNALTSGFHRALLASSVFLVAAAVIALRATNTKGEPMPGIEVDESHRRRRGPAMSRLGDRP